MAYHAKRRIVIKSFFAVQNWFGKWAVRRVLHNVGEKYFPPSNLYQSCEGPFNSEKEALDRIKTLKQG